MPFKNWKIMHSVQRSYFSLLQRFEAMSLYHDPMLMSWHCISV